MTQSELARQKVYARTSVYRAMRSGQLVRPESCSVCGARGNIQAHHPDHTKRLSVQWLCRRCHCSLHRTLCSAGARMGRKPLLQCPRVLVVRLEQPDHQWVLDEAARQKISASEYIRRLIAMEKEAQDNA